MFADYVGKIRVTWNQTLRIVFQWVHEHTPQPWVDIPDGTSYRVIACILTWHRSIFSPIHVCLGKPVCRIVWYVSNHCIHCAVYSEGLYEGYMRADWGIWRNSSVTWYNIPSSLPVFCLVISYCVVWILYVSGVLMCMDTRGWTGLTPRYIPVNQSRYRCDILTKNILPFRTSELIIMQYIVLYIILY